MLVLVHTHFQNLLGLGKSRKYIIDFKVSSQPTLKPFSQDDRISGTSRMALNKE